MARIIKFIDDDKELLIKIKTFQEEQNLKSFIAAVRILCENGLKLNKVLNEDTTKI